MIGYYIGENLALLEQLYRIFSNDDVLRNRGLVRRVYRIMLQNIITPSMHIDTIYDFKSIIENLGIEQFKLLKGSGFKSALAYSRMRNILLKYRGNSHTKHLS
jgi:hypothetical protein